LSALSYGIFKRRSKTKRTSNGFAKSSETLIHDREDIRRKINCPDKS